MNKKKLALVGVLVAGVVGIFAATRFIGNESEAIEETISISHDLGETEVSTKPEKVVVFDYGILDSLDAIGVTGIVGVVQSGLPEYLGDYKSSEYTSIGSLKEPDMEAVYGLQPDLIIISGRQSDYYEELNKIAPTIHLGIDNENYLQSFTNNMNILGDIFGKEKEVENELKSINKAIETLNTKITEKGVNGLITLANDGAFSVYGQESRFGIIHNAFGVIPVDDTIDASTHGQSASFEYIVEKNPEYVFVVDRGQIAGGSTSAEELFNNELMATTDAYKNGNIVYLDPVIWYTVTGGITSTMTMVDEIDAAVS